MGVDKHPQLDHCPKCGSVADLRLHGDTVKCESCGRIVRTLSGNAAACLTLHRDAVQAEICHRSALRTVVKLGMLVDAHTLLAYHLETPWSRVTKVTMTTSLKRLGWSSNFHSYPT